MDHRPQPTRAQLDAAYGRSVPDQIAPNLKVLFIGINPSLYTAAVGHHFARPGNRFWPALHAAGFTPRLLSSYDEHELLAAGYGITNVVDRATATADELAPAEYLAGARRLAQTIRRHRPAVAAFLGIGAYRAAFGKPKAVLGPQDERIGATTAWVLPNPSGLNAHYQLRDLAALYRSLREAAETIGESGSVPPAPTRRA
jgi:TDG/mug DNA glycosylase family protein